MVHCRLRLWVRSPPCGINHTRIITRRSWKPSAVPRSATSRVALNAPAQPGEEFAQVGELIVRVQPARVGKHPEPCLGHLLSLSAATGPRPREGGAVGADAEERD